MRAAMPGASAAEPRVAAPAVNYSRQPWRIPGIGLAQEVSPGILLLISDRLAVQRWGLNTGVQRAHLARPRRQPPTRRPGVWESWPCAAAQPLECCPSSVRLFCSLQLPQCVWMAGWVGPNKYACAPDLARGCRYMHRAAGRGLQEAGEPFPVQTAVHGCHPHPEAQCACMGAAHCTVTTTAVYICSRHPPSAIFPSPPSLLQALGPPLATFAARELPQQRPAVWWPLPVARRCRGCR